MINPDGAGKERSRLVKSVVLAMRELMRQSEPDEHSRDLAAYIALALLQTNETIEASVGAWEKKGYWVKADRFRMEWAWAERIGKQIREAVLNDDWATIALMIAQLGGKLNNVDVPIRHRLGTPWVGAFQQLNKTKPGGIPPGFVFSPSLFRRIHIRMASLIGASDTRIK